LILSVGAARPSAAVTITFANLPVNTYVGSPNPGAFRVNTLLQDGFDFTGNGLYVATAGAYHILTSGDGSGAGLATMALHGGGAFNVSQVIYGTHSGIADTVTFTGYLVGGGTVTQQFSISSGTGIANLVGFNNITSLTWNMDNTAGWMGNNGVAQIVTALPEPAAGLLLALPFLTMLLTRRRTVPQEA
jgi:hypothetical protein